MSGTASDFSAALGGLEDDFNGDNLHLIRCIEALLDLDAKGVLRPHGVGGHGRTLLSAAAVRLSRVSADPLANLPVPSEE